MEEDSGVKAPVTRLRRRLSVEQTEESNSPAANTPTKRRPGRRPAKPELELIEENATPQDIKKSIAKDLIDSTEDRPLTPSRRSARIRSNTSIVSETATVDSPRAKRATRRLSQVGSDSEAIVTPVKQTRRTRKDSTSSIDKADNQAAIKQPNLISEAITEESETNKESLSSLTSNEKDEIKPVRKSPRLQEKKERKSTSSPNENDQITHVENTNSSRSKLDQLIKQEENDMSPVEIYVIIDPASNKNDIADLLENVSSIPNKEKTVLNKSTSALENYISKSERLRTQSCTIATELTAHDNIFHSDNESPKKVFRGFVNSSLTNKSAIEDSILNKSKNKDNSIIEPDITDGVKSNEYEQIVYDDLKNTVEANTNVTIINKSINNVQSIFEKNPTVDMKVTITVENTDSNDGKINRTDDDDDQRVPEVGDIIVTSFKSDTFNTTKEKKNIHDTCEPMDVDETIPDSLLIDHNGEENQTEQSLHKSEKKSSILQSLDDSGNQNKSTLMLSHLKDISTSEANKSSKSPLKINSNCLSNSSTVLNITQENIAHNKNLSLCYSTSTPIQQKSKEKDNVNTSAINNDSKLTKNKVNKSKSESDSSKLHTSDRKTSKSKKEKPSTITSNYSVSAPSQENSNFMNDEAEDAGDDYESGDSQDEEERKEAFRNEIRDKGETLSTEEDISNDSDYEKDSFIVSSAEEDNELLEGTDDDLSMSDNELNMSKKSKEKYNERKLKEQKKASREMYESRHQINNSNNSLASNKGKKTNRTRQRLSSSDSDQEIKKTSKSKNKQRIDSSQDESMTLEVNKKTSRRSKTPSLSTNNENETLDNEKEITLPNLTSNECDPLSECIKTEPKTPQHENMSLAFINAHNDSKDSIKDDEKLDPLATTLAYDGDSSMSSDNERIVQDYDSVLQGLNKTKNNKVKTAEISLNIDNKQKNKEKNQIVDQLNLTQVKSKKDKNKIVSTSTKLSVDSDENSSSDSALLHLLFSEDSINCEDSSKKNKNLSDSDEYISLKRVDGKTEIQNNSANDQLLNQTNTKSPGSGNKKKLQHETSLAEEPGTNESLIDQANKTPASDKKKKRQQSENSAHEELNTDESPLDQNNKTPASGKKKKRHQSETSVHEEFSANDSTANESTSKTPSSGKKKKEMSKSEPMAEMSANNSMANESISITPASGKKNKKNKISESEPMAEMSANNSKANEPTSKTPASGKKNKKNKISESEPMAEMSANDSTANESTSKTPASLKKNKKKNMSESEPMAEMSSQEGGLQFFIDTDGTKEQNLSMSNKSLNRSKISLSDKDTTESLVDQSNKTPGSGKKKKRQQSETSVHEELSPNGSVVNQSTSKTPASGKKKKQKMSESEPTADMNSEEGGHQFFIDTDGTKEENISMSNKSLNRSKISLSDKSANDSVVNQSTSRTPSNGKKKKQKKLSESELTVEMSSEEGGLQFFIDTDGTKEQNLSMSNKSLNRSKISLSDKAHDDSDSDAPMEISFRKETSTSKDVYDTELSHEKSMNQSMKSIGSSKKNKKKNRQLQAEDAKVSENDQAQTSNETNKGSGKKKKNRASVSFNTSMSTENDTPKDSSFNKLVTNTHSDKMQKHSNISFSEVEPQDKTPQSGKMKKILDAEHSEENRTIPELNMSQNKTSSSKKKQKRLSETAQNEIGIVDEPVHKTSVSAKKTLSDTYERLSSHGDDSTEHKNKKRKRKISALVPEEDKNTNETDTLNTSVLSKKKKIKLTQQEEHEAEMLKKNKNKKRKEREDDVETATKAFKENSSKNVQVSRLPTALLEQLDEKPKKISEAERKPKRPKLIATTNFIVEGKVRRNKPSMYLEESIYLNEDETESKKHKAKNVIPKVLPFVPTASTSIKGFTSNFKISVLPKDTKFVAQSSNIDNFKTNYLYNKKIKRNGTYDQYKISRNIKLSKF